MSTDRITTPGAFAGASANSYILSEAPAFGQRLHSGGVVRRGHHFTPEVQLNPLQVSVAWRLLNHQYVKACDNEIDKRLFSGRGIAVHRGDEPQIPSLLFEQFLRRDMIPFARDAINAFLAIGIIPIAFRHPRVAGLGLDGLAPYVPAPESYYITTWSEDGIQRYSFYWADGRRDDRVLIAHDFNANPMLDGTLTSKIASLSADLLLATELRRLLVVAERTSAEPTLVLGYNMAIEAAARAAAVQAGEFAGDIDACQRREDFLFERNSAQQRSETADAMRQWGSQTGLDPRVEFGQLGASLLNNTHDMYTNMPPREHGIPEHRLRVTDTVVAQRTASSRSDYTQILNQISSNVCRVMNVPEGAIAANESVKAGVEATIESMHRTINHYADMMSGLMTNVYRHIVLQKDFIDELRSRVDRKRKSPFDLAAQLLTEEDLFEAKRNVEIRLSFDLPPTTTLETLHDLRNRDLITYRAYKEAALRLEGFSIDHLNDSPDPFTREERKEMVLGPKKPEAKTSTLHKQATKKKKRS